MANGFDRFNKKWANLGLLNNPTDAQSDQGYSYIGPVPPSVEQFNAIEQWGDEKDNWLYGQIDEVIQAAGLVSVENDLTLLLQAIQSIIGGPFLPLTGGELSGSMSSGMPIPADQMPGLGQLYSQSVASTGGFYLNAYVTAPSAWSYLVNGAAAFFDLNQNTNDIIISGAVPGVAGAPITFVPQMVIDIATRTTALYGDVWFCGETDFLVTTQGGGFRWWQWDLNHFDYLRQADGQRVWTAGLAGVNAIMQLSEAGDLTITGTYAPPSDMRLKRNVQDYIGGLAEILQLRPISFEWNGLGQTPDNGDRMYGLTAQEVDKVMPEFVKRSTGKLRDTDEQSTEMLKLNAFGPMLALINAFKEVDQRLKVLEDAGV